MRALRPFGAGSTLLLRQAVGDLPRGAVVTVMAMVDGSDPPTYLVQPLVSVVGDHLLRKPVPLGPVVTVEGALLARSLPGFRSGVTIVLPS